ncbi:MAG: bifunctional diaminohydroxyphosphoribosylaminopyrimidine deaminase/5-amino-6-(5-phosphoribosylamino)uracil reductase RibD [Candidatus Puniceispirillaceae bacterium]
MTDTPTAQKISNTDCHWMRVAIAASRRAEGRTAENPPVGCAIVSAAGQLLSVGHTGKGGRPHAETEAMAKSPAALLAGATAYVTLEPCAHTGQTGPCADALIARKIARVVIAVADPDKRVNGAGIKRLRAAGIAVEVGVCAAEAGRVLAGFLMRQTASRPFVTWKTATSLDGMIALADGQKRWLTGPEMRRYVHLLRSRTDGLLSAIGTVLADDPEFTCRLPGLSGDGPARFILDTNLRTPASSALVRTCDQAPLTLFHREGAPSDRMTALADAGVALAELPLDAEGRLDLPAAMQAMAATGCNHVMVEAGAGLSGSLFSHDLIDRIVWTQSHHLIGGDAIPAIGGMSMLALPDRTHYILSDEGRLGDDRWLVLDRRSGEN